MIINKTVEWEAAWGVVAWEETWISRVVWETNLEVSIFYCYIPYASYVDDLHLDAHPSTGYGQNDGPSGGMIGGYDSGSGGNVKDSDMSARGDSYGDGNSGGDDNYQPPCGGMSNNQYSQGGMGSQQSSSNTGGNQPSGGLLGGLMQAGTLSRSLLTIV